MSRPTPLRTIRASDVPACRRVIIATPEFLHGELARYERQYGMSSEEFLRRWEAGELGDAQDLFWWRGLCTMAIAQGMLSPPPSLSRPGAPSGGAAPAGEAGPARLNGLADPEAAGGHVLG